MQLPFRPPFAHANFQLGRKGQRPKGRKVKGQNFKKLAEAILTLFQALCIGFTSFLVLKMVIVEDQVVSVHCAFATSMQSTEHIKTSKGEVPWTAFRSQAFFAGLIEVCRGRRRAILPLTFQLDNCCRRVKYVQEYAYSLHVIVFLCFDP